MVSFLRDNPYGLGLDDLVEETVNEIRPERPSTSSCAGGPLARAHACSCDPYLGGSTKFDQAIAEFPKPTPT